MSDNKENGLAPLVGEPLPEFEFHLSRKCRDKYGFDERLFQTTGNVVFADYAAVRRFVDRVNEVRDAHNHPDRAVRAGQVNAMGLIDEILHQVVARYRSERNPLCFREALARLDSELRPRGFRPTLAQFVNFFPPVAVYRGEQSPSAYLAGESAGYPHELVTLEEALLLALENENPAFAPFSEFFDDAELERDEGYPRMMPFLEKFFKTQPVFGPQGQNLLDLLRAPFRASPYSLTGQLLYIKDHWQSWLPPELMEKLIERLLVALDYIKEEEKIRGLGPGPTLVPDFSRGLRAGELEYERYSPDLDWMPKVVLLVKHTYVWLYQLSQKYKRDIHRLDQIPDDELDRIADWGFTGLWLIGLWQRSSASRVIKQRCGNPDAAASAYSLYAYEIADELGGQSAYENLRDRARRRGIRIGVDMVPNHTGIYSRWIIEHPDWYIQLDHPPFPAYRFNGPDLSEDDRIGLQIEDGYWDRRDAAVVFKRWDKRTGEVRYIYHGNDGTCMPWNDTAQLNFLIPQVREAVIQEILRVARMSPIIRFDAAMTLTKRHYHRLWFPEPGAGGDIPSRAGRGMTREEFDKAFPVEFWREVVDRVAQEAPDTLLLAEAFWLMEGFFVRTLGMHRVYNSAFMNMLKREDNANYRNVLKNILEFDPEILRRLVNFMNNPDEETAVAQFGKDDKYFGVCTMMVTMPGLPMFGHGQLEGFTEKYGMEYRRSYWNEQVDWHLFDRHVREIFPLLKKRYLFSGTEHFYLYDFYRSDGAVNEDVFAYSNRAGDERVLVLYNNRYAHAAGWVRTSAAYAVKGPGDEKRLARKSLAEALGLSADADVYYIFADHASGLEFIRSGRDLAQNGLYAELGAFKYHVFWRFREVRDNAAGDWSRLCSSLSGRGVPSIDEALQEMLLRPVLDALREWLHPDYMRKLIELYRDPPDPLPTPLPVDLDARLRPLLAAVKEHLSTSAPKESAEPSRMFRLLLEIEACSPSRPHTGERTTEGSAAPDPRFLRPALDYVLSQIPAEEGERFAFGRTFAVWLMLAPLFRSTGSGRAAGLIPEAILKKIVVQSLTNLGCDRAAAERDCLLAHILHSDKRWFEPGGAIVEILKTPPVQEYLVCNWHGGVFWFNKESLESLVYWACLTRVLEILYAQPPDAVRRIAELRERALRVVAVAGRSGYRFQEFLTLLGGDRGPQSQPEGRP